jgi:AcrR family transcriptional regulator
MVRVGGNGGGWWVSQMSDNCAGGGRPPGAKATVTHEKLVKIAREVFSQRGYDGTTYAEVAERAGLTRAALNYHFGDKRALYHDVIEDTYTDVVAPAIDLAAQQTSLARQLTVFMKTVGDAVAQDRFVAAFLCTSAGECQARPELRHPIYCPLTIGRRFLTGAVKDAVDRGELPFSTRVEPLVDALAATLMGIDFFAGFVSSPPQMRAITTELKHMLTGRLWASTD